MTILAVKLNKQFSAFCETKRHCFRTVIRNSYCVFLGLVFNDLVLKLFQHILRTENANMLNGKTVCDA